MTLTLPPRVTARAFARLAEIAELTGEQKALRVAVEGGGCSGFQYDIKLDDPAADDLVLEGGGQKVLVDQVSLITFAAILSALAFSLYAHQLCQRRTAADVAVLNRRVGLSMALFFTAMLAWAFLRALP